MLDSWSTVQSTVRAILATVFRKGYERAITEEQPLSTSLFLTGLAVRVGSQILDGKHQRGLKTV